MGFGDSKINISPAHLLSKGLFYIKSPFNVVLV